MRPIVEVHHSKKIKSNEKLMERNERHTCHSGTRSHMTDVLKRVRIFVGPSSNWAYELLVEVLSALPISKGFKTLGDFLDMLGTFSGPMTDLSIVLANP